MIDTIESILIFIEPFVWLTVLIFIYRDLYKNVSWKNTSGKFKIYRILTVIGLGISLVLLFMELFGKLVGMNHI